MLTKLQDSKPKFRKTLTHSQQNPKITTEDIISIKNIKY
jgi:hypothetical protein